MEPHRAAKTIGTSLDAQVRLGLPVEAQEQVKALGESLEDLLVISGLELHTAPEVLVEVLPHEGPKCPRCWNHKGGAGAGEDAALCPRCAEVILNGASA